MPLYNEDIDTPVPPRAVGALRQQVAASDAVLLISPSHNGSMAAALKNAIDWLSRPRGMAPLLGRVVSVRSLGGRAPGDVPAVREAVASALVALAGAVT